MINGGLLAWKEIVLFEDTLPVSNHGGGLPWLRAAFLLTTLTWGAERRWLHLACGSMQSVSSLTVSKDSCAHEELDLLEPNVSKAEMPMEQFFLSFTEVGIPLGHSGQSTG